MNDVIVELKKERDRLRHRLEMIDASISEYERWAKTAAGLVKSDVQSDNAVLVDEPTVDAEGTATPIVEFEKKVRALFSRVSAPLKRTEVYEALSEADVVVGGREPLNTLASRLSRMDGITNLKGYGYWAEDRPYPAAGYEGRSTPGAPVFDEE